VRANCALAVINCDPHRNDVAMRHGAATLAFLACAMLIVSLDQYIGVVALPDIGRDLGYSSQTLQSVISAYAVASSGFLLLGGRAADLLGRRRMLATGLALYVVASLARGLRSSAHSTCSAVASAEHSSSQALSPPSTPPSRRSLTVTARWASGAGPARPAWSSASCSAACSHVHLAGKRCSL